MKTKIQSKIEEYNENNYSLLSEYYTDYDELYDLDLHSIAHENADGNENVIYHAQAHELILNASIEVEDNAIQAANDCQALESKSYNEMACAIAYFIKLAEYEQQLENEKESFIEFLESLKFNAEDDQAELESLIETLENL